MEKPKRLVRSKKDRLLAGVCGGVAEFLNLDPTSIRLAWALASIAFGFGIIVYVVAWLIVPNSPV